MDTVFRANRGFLPLFAHFFTTQNRDNQLLAVLGQPLIKLRNRAEEIKGGGYRERLKKQEYTTTLRVGNMTPGEIDIDFLSMAIPEDGELNLKVEITSRNVFVEQYLHFTKANTLEREMVQNTIKVNGKEIEKSELYSRIPQQNANQTTQTTQ